MEESNINNIPKKFRGLGKSFIDNIVKDNNYSFRSFPKGVNFHGKESNEEIILVIRAHWIILAFHVFFSVLVLCIPFLILFIKSTFLLGGSGSFMFSLFIFSVIIATTVLTTGFVRWFYNVSIITNQRVVDLDFINVMSHSVSEAQLDKIQDVTHKQTGLLGSLFDMGSVYIQTAGAKSEIEFHNIPRPRDVQDILVDLLELKKKRRI